MLNPFTVCPVDSERYYVYGLFTPDGVPFYIGKGRDRRVNEHFRPCRLKEDSFKNRVIKKYGVGRIKREILCYFEVESQAYDFEEYLISLYKLKNDGGCLTNALRSNKDFPVVSKEANLRKGLKAIKYPEEVVLKVYKLYFEDCVRANQISKILGVNGKAVLGFVNNVYRKDLYNKYISSGEIKNNLGVLPQTPYDLPNKISDEDLLLAYSEVCSGGSYQYLSEKFDCTVGWLRAVFCGAARKHLNLNIKKDRTVPAKRIKQETPTMQLKENNQIVS